MSGNGWRAQGGYGIHTFDRICGPGAEPNEANEAPNEANEAPNEADDQQAAKREVGYP